MENTEEKRLDSLENLQDEKLQIALMKIVAEQNHEKFLEYDCASDVALFYVVSNGRFVIKEVMMDFRANKEEQIYARVAPEDRGIYGQELRRCMQKPTSRVFDIRYLDENGEKKWHRVYLVSIADENNKVYKLAARFISNHKEKLATDLLRMQAERDSLTGVYNHKNYEDLCRDLIRKNSDGILYLMLDIDDFKQLNDTYGHHVGDSIIKQVGEVLQLAVKDFGVAGRIGGDEFSVCMINIWDKETASAICIRIKEALKKSKEGVEFSISIGAARSGGRICTFEELYYEADEALYFVKEHGKDQILFAEDMSQRKREFFEELQQESLMTNEEFALDQMPEYRIVTEPYSKKIWYINKQARKALGISLEEAQKLSCYELLLGRCKDCDVCELYTNQVHVLDDEESKGLRKYIPNGKFILMSGYCSWKGEPARMIRFVDVNNSKHVKCCLEQQIESQEAISKCWNIIHETTSQEVDYTKVLKVINEYYDADCTAILTKEGEEYKDLFEFHKSKADAVAEGIRKSLAEGIFTKMEVLIDEEGYMRRRHIEKKLLENIELIPMLEQGFVHSTLGIKLARRDDFVGVLLVVNPSHHTEDYTILKRIGIFFTTDLLRRTLSDYKTYEEKHDMLTKLWNRAYFAEWQAKFGCSFKKNYGVFTADIMHLTDINREFGYEDGNARILAVADIFKSVFSGYSVFRYDDDQMMAICHNIDKVAFQKLVDYAKEQMEELDVEMSKGYSWTADGDIADVIREANDYLEKDRERLQKENDEEGKVLQHIENGVLEQIEKGNFRVFLQPKISIASGKTVGGEALIRLYDEVRGFVSPAFFIPLLEQRGAVYLIDLFVLQEVFRFQKKAIDEGKEVVPISVNFSKNTLMFKWLLLRIKELSEEYPIPDGLIEIEITETISSMDHMMVNNIANALRNMGFSVSMDDFGTKYSNMAVLTQFEFDTVKVDRSLLLDVERNKKNLTVLKHTLEMLKDLGVETVMEGVETAEQVEILRGLGCDIVQGYYYGRPEPMDRFYELFM